MRLFLFNFFVQTEGYHLPLKFSTIYWPYSLEKFYNLIIKTGVIINIVNTKQGA